MNWVWFTMSVRPSVILKKNRSVETLWLRDARATRRQMKLIAAYVFEARRVGRPAEEGSEVLDPLRVVMPSLWR
jgi:hypothetical protein